MVTDCASLIPETRTGEPTLGADREYLHLGSISEALVGVSSHLDCVDTVVERAIDLAVSIETDFVTPPSTDR